MLLLLLPSAGGVATPEPVIFYQTGGGQSPLKRKPRPVVVDFLDKLNPPVEEAPAPIVAIRPKVDIAALKARADAAENALAQLTAQVTTAKREHALARLKKDYAASLKALEEARVAEHYARLRDEDDFFLLAA